jgi:hypothetical protein
MKMSEHLTKVLAAPVVRDREGHAGSVEALADLMRKKVQQEAFGEDTEGTIVAMEAVAQYVEPDEVPDHMMEFIGSLTTTQLEYLQSLFTGDQAELLVAELQDEVRTELQIRKGGEV